MRGLEMATNKGLLLGICMALLPACAGSQGGKRFDDPSAIAVMEPTQGSMVRGAVDFVRKGDAVVVTANLSGFEPHTTHGFHIHETGDCTARDGSSAGEHFNPANAEHGGPGGGKRHGGDLGNITADDRGYVSAKVVVDGIAFGSGADSIVGRGLIVHAGADDLKSQPAGNSGARLACGVITRNPDRRTYSQG